MGATAPRPIAGRVRSQCRTHHCRRALRVRMLDAAAKYIRSVTRACWCGSKGRRGPRTGVRMVDYVCNPLLARAGSTVGQGNVVRRWQERRAYMRTVDARVRAALERVGAAGCAEQRWETMSDWERALVEVAHAIAGDPALLVVDDVADNLGIGETKDFIKLLRAIGKERKLAVLMSVSDANATLLSDRIGRQIGRA